MIHSSALEDGIDPYTGERHSLDISADNAARIRVAITLRISRTVRILVLFGVAGSPLNARGCALIPVACGLMTKGCLSASNNVNDPIRT